MLEKPALADNAILACLQAGFGVRADSLEFLPIGNDATAWAYRVRVTGVNYFLKVKSGKLKEAALTIPRYLRDQGLCQVVAPLPTPSGLLYHPLESFSLILYPFIAGLNGMQAGNWAPSSRKFTACGCRLAWQTNCRGRVLRPPGSRSLPA